MDIISQHWGNVKPMVEFLLVLLYTRHANFFQKASTLRRLVFDDFPGECLRPEEPSSAARICVTGEYVSPFPSTSRTELTSLRPARELHTTDRLAGSALEIGRARRAQHSLRRDENGVKEQRRYVRYSSTAVLCCYLYAIPTGSHKQDSHQVLRYPARPLFPRNRQGRALATRPYMTLDGRPALASHPPASPAISRSA